ncbi:uncharacterized protein LOC105665307 isoform X1 [Ceratitis capitata]|uniref:uncharacterized protein LOC105665307 isoform X1 n=1 Tax=Ceratitis capitata TaxID=7213 RepID=UPI000A10C97F|nr:uncharacterized protein LOC105665307 isoform X1 [Ceratitis capitata]
MNSPSCIYLISLRHLSQRIIWNTSFPDKQLRYMLFIFYLLSCREITCGKETTLQRRFMWKQMHMDNLMSDMATGAYAMKHMLSDLVPTAHSVVPRKLLDYLPSETTRVKYIIHNPTTKKPVKIIKLRPTKKVVKIMHKPSGTTDLKVVNPHKNGFPPHLSNDQMEKLEKQQELIAEGRLSFKTGDNLLNQISEGEKQAQQTQPEIHEEYNSWLPVLDTGNLASEYPLHKPNVLSSLHTSIMAESLPKPEKQIAENPIISNDEVNQHQNFDILDAQDYHDQAPHSNSYEVTEHIAEESVALPLSQGSRISVRIGNAPSRFSLKQGTNIPNREKFSTTSTTTTTEEPPNYPPSFLRRFQERSNAVAASASPTSAIRTKQRKILVEQSDWTPGANIGNSREAVKLRTRLQGMKPRIKSEKWPPEPLNSSSPTSITHSTPDKFSASDSFAEINSSIFTTATTTPNSAIETKQLSAKTASGRLRDQPQSPSVKGRQRAELPKLQQMRLNNRGSIKFGDKIFLEE